MRVPEQTTGVPSEQSASPKKKRAVKSAKSKKREPGEIDEKMITVAEVRKKTVFASF